MDYRGEGRIWYEYIMSILNDIYSYLLKMFFEISNGKFDYWQAIYDVCDKAQKSLIKISKYYGPDRLFSKILFKVNILNLLMKVKTYAKGPGAEIIHQQRYD